MPSPRRTLPKGFEYTRWLVERERCQLSNHLPEPPFKEPARVGERLNSALKKFGVAYSADESRIHREWVDIVGKDLAKHAIPGALSGGTLCVFVMGSAWFAELKRSGTQTLLVRINDHCGAGTVKHISLQSAPTGYKS